jgi:hypothetical protein
MDSLTPEDEAEVELLCFRTMVARARLAAMIPDNPLAVRRGLEAD